MKLLWHQFELLLQHEFTISRGSCRVQPTLVVELQDGPYRGFGEATANAYYGATVEGMTKSLEQVRPLVESWTLGDPQSLWLDLRPRLEDQPFALCALDEAAHDLWGKQRGRPVYRLWGLQTHDLPASSYTIGIDTLENMVQKLHEFPGWPVYKIKLGTDRDLEIVRGLRSHTDAVLRVDANCGWSAAETLRNAAAMKPLGVQFIEQPLPADDWQGMQQVYAESALPVMADESCVDLADVERCVDHFHGVNVKAVKCGGLTPARRMIQRASQLGLKTMIGCMTESSVGISAVAQLLPLVDYADLDGAVLLERDIATGVTIDRGQCCYPEENGTGAQLLT